MERNMKNSAFDFLYRTAIDFLMLSYETRILIGHEFDLIDEHDGNDTEDHVTLKIFSGALTEGIFGDFKQSIYYYLNENGKEIIQ